MNAISLPMVSDARLPQVYAAATHALAQCVKIDECQAWADKAEAMASYARQARDDTLRRMCDRIQARAIKRCGDLLELVPSARGANLTGEGREGTLPISREQAATDAGLSEHQRKTALRVAAVPDADFERQVESDNPPSVTQLAAQGTRHRAVDLGGIDPKDYARATQAIGALRDFARSVEGNDPRAMARAVKPHEVAALQGYVAAVDAWLDVFVSNLPEGSPCTRLPN